MRLSVLYFALLRERIGCAQEVLEEPPGLRLGELRQALEVRHPVLADLRNSLQIAVNQEIATTDRLLGDGDEVAFIPPVSGGSSSRGHFFIRDSPLRLEAVISAVSDAQEQGAVATFAGVVRGHNHGKKVRHLEYEAYAPMAERVLSEIAAEIVAEVPGVRLAIEHRTGRLQVGETAVVIAASAPHRKEAFSACQAAIDRLKARAPIWKKEVSVDGEEWIGQGRPEVGVDSHFAILTTADSRQLTADSGEKSQNRVDSPVNSLLKGGLEWLIS